MYITTWIEQRQVQVHGLNFPKFMSTVLSREVTHTTNYNVQYYLPILLLFNPCLYILNNFADYS